MYELFRRVETHHRRVFGPAVQLTHEQKQCKGSKHRLKKYRTPLLELSIYCGHSAGVTKNSTTCLENGNATWRGKVRHGKWNHWSCTSGYPPCTPSSVWISFTSSRILLAASHSSGGSSSEVPCDATVATSRIVFNLSTILSWLPTLLILEFWKQPRCFFFPLFYPD